MEDRAYRTVEVAERTGFTLRQLDYWAHHNVVVPTTQQPHGQGTRKLYSVEDLLQLHIIRHLKDQGWSTQKIRKAVATMREVMEDPHPLRYAVLFDGHGTLFALCKTREGRRILLDTLNAGGQQVMWIVLETLAEETREPVYASPVKFAKHTQTTTMGSS